jgi:hypothetical protein
MALGANDFNELLSATIQKIEKQLVDNVLTAHPTLDFLKQNVKSATGPSVIYPIVAADDTSTVFTDASGTFNTGKSSDILGVAKYDWAEPLVSKVRVEFKQLEMNSGPEAVVSLAKAHLDAAVKGHGKKIATVLHTAGSAGAGAFNTLDEVISNSDTLTSSTSRTVGGIRGGVSTQTIVEVARQTDVAFLEFAAATHDFIVGDTIVVAGTTVDGGSLNGTQTVTVVGANFVNFASVGANVGTTADTGTATNSSIKDYWRATEKTILATGGGAQDIITAFRTISDDIYVASGERPNAIIAGRNVFAEYENSFDNKVTYNAPLGSADSRFRELAFDGIPVRLDPDCPTNSAYFINTDYLKAAYLASNFMKAMPAQQIVGTLDTVTPLATVLCFGTNNRRAHGKLNRL